MVQNSLDSFPEIGTGDSGDTGHRRFQIEFADPENPLRVDARFTTQLQYFLVAAPLPLVTDSLPDPPNQRMEPEHRFDKHLNGSDQIVSVSHVANLMRDHALPLLGSQMIENPFGQ